MLPKGDPFSGKAAQAGVSNGQKPLLTVAAVTEVNYPRLRCIRAWGGAPSLFGSRPQIVHLKKDQERRSSPSRATLDHTPSLRSLARSCSLIVSFLAIPRFVPTLRAHTACLAAHCTHAACMACHIAPALLVPRCRSRKARERAGANSALQGAALQRIDRS